MRKIAILSTSLLLLLFTACHNDNSSSTTDQDNTSGNNQSLVQPGVQGTSIQGDSNNSATSTTPVTPGSTGATASTNTAAGANSPYTVSKPYYIRGHLKGGAGGTVILDELGIGTTKPLFSQTINPQELYDFEGSLTQPTLLQLRLPAGRIHLVVYPGDTIYVESELAHPENFTATGKGALETMRLKSMYLILEAANTKKRALQDQLDKADKSQVAKLVDQQAVKYHQIEDEKHENLMKYIQKIDTSFVSILACQYLDPDKNFDFMEKIDKKFANKFPNSPFYQALDKKVQAFSVIQLGHQAPEILSNTPENKIMRLSDLRGKYVLIDFWASWCGPCRSDMPALKKLYDKYKPKNLEILGVSLDNNRQNWLSAIQEDKATWPEVSDLSGFSSAAAQTYLVGAIPTSFLVGPDGKILARYLRGQELESKLASLLH